MSSAHIQKLIENVDDLKASLKDANAVLKEALMETTMYKAIISATMEVAEKMPEKAVSAQALKVSLAVFTTKADES